MPFKRLQARRVPLLRPFKKIGLAGMRRWVERRFLLLSNTAVIGHKPASEDTSVSLVHWQEPYSHRGRVLAETVASFPASGVYRGASRTIDLGSSPAPFKRLRPFKESAAQAALKRARARVLRRV